MNNAANTQAQQALNTGKIGVYVLRFDRGNSIEYRYSDNSSLVIPAGRRKPYVIA